MYVHNSILMLCKIFGDFHFHRKFIYITGLGIIYVWAQFNFYDSVKYFVIFIFNRKFIYITDLGIIYVCAQFNFDESAKYLEIFIFNPKFIYITDRGFIYVCAQFILTILPKIWRFMNPKYNTSPIKVTSMSTIQFFMLCKIFGDFNSKD